MSNLPIFGPEFADCSGCELRTERDRGRCVPAATLDPRAPTAMPVPAQIPEDFNGIMLIGEGPGATEVSRRVPFCGPSGRLLDRMLAAASIDRAQCFVTNATICATPVGQRDENNFHEAFPGAIYSCLPRLEKEIAEVRPRVIVTLGQPALIAVAGRELKKQRMVPADCGFCSNTRQIGPVLACSKGDCTWYQRLAGDVAARAEELKTQLGGACPKCTANLKRLKPRQIKCPFCLGRKTKLETFTTFVHDHTLSEIVGGLLDASKLPAKLDQLGVEWVIPTYHPSFCLRPVDAQSGSKKFGGQFAARAVVDHFDKARRLAQGAQRAFQCSVEISDQADDLAAYVKHWGAELPFVVDIETDSEDGAFQVGEIRVVGIRRVGQPVGLVLDTRGLRGRNWRDQNGELHVCTREEWEGTVFATEYTESAVELYHALYAFMTNPTIKKVLQNGHYDRTTMAWFWWLETAGQVGDTMLAYGALYPDEPQSLAFMGGTLTDCESWKPPKKKKGMLAFETFEELAIYNARDLGVTDLAAEVMGADGRGKGRLDEEGLRDIYELDIKLLDLAVRMTLKGMPISLSAREAVRTECVDAIDRASYEIRKGLVEAGVPAQRLDQWKTDRQRVDGVMKDVFVPWSATNKNDLVWALFAPDGPFRLEPLVFTDKTKQPSASKEALLKYADQPFVKAILEHNKYEKILSTFIEGSGMRILDDGCIHPVWKVAGAVTGRWSSSPNFQNWVKSIRQIVEAPEGWMIVGADYDQLELRTMAALSGDPELIRRCMYADASRKLEPDWDPHSYTASLVFGSTFTGLALEDPNHKKTKPGEPSCKCQRCKRAALRDVTKRVVYGLNYGAGGLTVLKAIYDGGYEGPPITLQIIDRAVAEFFRAFPGVLRWRERTLREAQQSREVRSWLGRRRIFPLGEVDTTVAYNFGIQAGSGDIVNTRTVLLDERLRQQFPNSAFIIAQVHDALYSLVREDVADAVCDLTTATLSTSLSLADGAPEMTFSAKAHKAKNWKDAA